MHIFIGEEIAGIMAALSNVRNGIKRLADETEPGQRYLTDTQLAQELSLSKRTLAIYSAKGEFGYYNQNQFQRIVQCEVPRSAGFCAVN